MKYGISDMRITNEIPESWRDLQDKVCKYLNQAGYHAETTKTIEMVRGKVEVDVFATSDDELLKQFICECKYWETPVPQEKIHAFRTVVHDSGSMLGIFISKTGYQKGAIEAAYCSNVLLKDWQGFIDMIAVKWLKNRFDEVMRIASPLATYTDVLDVPVEILSDEDRALNEQLLKRYLPPYMIGRKLQMGMHKEMYVDCDGIRFEDFNSLFNYLEDVYREGVARYGELFAKYKEAKLDLDNDGYMVFNSHICEYLTKE